MSRSLILLFFAIGLAIGFPNATNYIVPDKVVKVRQVTDLPIVTPMPEDEEDLGPLGEVQLDVEEEDTKIRRVRRGYSSGGGGGGGGGQQKQKGGGGQSKYGGGQQSQGGYSGGGGGQQQGGGGYGGGQGGGGY